MYRIGQLADRTGISIRTLRYYDELGLLKPSLITEAGYRYYSKDSVVRLQQILTLKQLGLTLANMKAILVENENQSETDRWKDAIDMQIVEVRRQRERLAQLERSLHAVRHTLEVRGDVDPGELLHFIRLLQRPADRARDLEERRVHIAKRFTDEEREVVEMLPMLDTDDPRTKEWVLVLGEVRSAMKRGADERTERELAQRLMQVAELLFQGKMDVLDKYWEWIRPGEEEGERVLGLDARTMDYIEAIVVKYAGDSSESDAYTSEGEVNDE